MQKVMEIIHLPKTHLGEGSAVSLVALGSVLLVLSTQAVALRFWARKRTVAQLLLDDWLSLPAWVCNWPEAPSPSRSLANMYACRR